MLEGLREPSESSSLEGRAPDPSPPRQGAELRLAQGLRRLPEPKDQRWRRVKLPRGVDVHCCDDLRCSDACVYIVGRLGVRCGTLEPVMWTD